MLSNANPSKCDMDHLIFDSEMRRHTVKGVVSSEMGVVSPERPEVGNEREVEKPQVKGGHTRMRKRKAEDKTEQAGLKKQKS